MHVENAIIKNIVAYKDGMRASVHSRSMLIVTFTFVLKLYIAIIILIVLNHFPAVEPENNIAAVIVEAVTDEIEPLSAKYETEERFVMDNQEQNPKSESVEETQKKSLTDKQSEMAQPMILSKKHDVTTCAADSTSKTEGLKKYLHT